MKTPDKGSSGLKPTRFVDKATIHARSKMTGKDIQFDVHRGEIVTVRDKQYLIDDIQLYGSATLVWCTVDGKPIPFNGDDLA